MTPIINTNGRDHTFAIETAQLSKTYPGGVEAVKGISLAVPHGEVFGLLGPNGAGKSTTVGMLTTTITPHLGPRPGGRLRRQLRSDCGAPGERGRLPGTGRRPAPHRPPQPACARPAVAI